jgi:ElaB/YqjD/DUF883 family membrane-anchored ribosome-binding protein
MAEDTNGASRGTHAAGGGQAVDQLKTDLRSLRSDLETAARTVNQLGGAAAAEAMHQAQAQMAEIQERIERLLEDAKDYSDRYADELRQYVQQRPFQSILIALAAGFTLAHLISRR